MIVLESARVKLAEASVPGGTQYVLMADQCVDGHSIFVIRLEGLEFGGLVIAHLDEDFDPEDVAEIVGMLTPAFLLAMQNYNFLGSFGWYYIDPDVYFGMPAIRIMGQEMEGKWQYWSHSLQCMIVQV